MNDTSSQRHVTPYGLFVCPACRDHPSDACDDACGLERPDELPPLWMSEPDDYWPLCRCCGARLYLVAPLYPRDSPGVAASHESESL